MKHIFAFVDKCAYFTEVEVRSQFSFVCVFPMKHILQFWYSVLYTTMDFLHLPLNIHFPLTLDALVQLQGESSKSLDPIPVVN